MSLPGALGDTRYLTLAGQVAETNAAEVEVADERTSAATQWAAIHTTALELRRHTGFVFFCSG